MFLRFLKLEWKSFFRSASLGKSIGLRIFLAIFAIYFMLIFLGTGFLLHDMLTEYFPGKNAVSVANTFVLIWLAADLFVRFFMQSLPVMNIKPFMAVPVSRKTQVHYVLLKSLFSYFNFLPLLLIIPFGLISYKEGSVTGGAAAAWIGSMVVFTVAVNYANFLIKKKFAENIKALLPFVILVAALAALEYYGVFNITQYTGAAFDALISMPFVSLLFILLPVGLYYLNLAYLIKNFYLDASIKRKSDRIDTTDYSWTRRFGDIAPFLQLDLKLIFRNKRPRTTVFLSFIFLFYGLIFLRNDSPSGEMMHVFAGIFITGIFMINFGQFIPAWDSAYYSLIMSQNISIRQYLASKAGLLTFSVVVLTVLSTPYAYFGTELLFTIVACAIYNIGINVPMLLFAGSFNKKKISLEKSPFMNYQGTGATQWIIGIPLLLLPMGIWVTLKFTVGYNTASAVLAAIGVAGIALRGVMMRKIASAYRTGKYAAISGFKEEEN